MAHRTRSLIAFSLILLVAISACQSVSPFGFLKSTETPIPPTSTATPNPTATITATPTITPTVTVTNTPTLPIITIPAGEVTVPILLYHHVSTDKADSRYNIDPGKFEQQMQWLYDNGYQTITISELVNLIYNGGEIPLRPVVITFDDGNLNNFVNAYPIMKKFGFVGTFYVVQRYVDSDDTMVSTDQLMQLIQNGWEIGSHSKTHAHLTFDGVDLVEEIRMSKLNLEKKLGVTIHSFAYPFGEINEDVIRLTSSYGYSSGVGLGESQTHSRFSVYYLSRIEIRNEYSMEQFEAYFPWKGPL